MKTSKGSIGLNTVNIENKKRTTIGNGTWKTSSMNKHKSKKKYKGQGK